MKKLKDLTFTDKLKNFLNQVRNNRCTLKDECNLNDCNKCDFATLFELRSKEGYRLAIVKDCNSLMGCSRTEKCPDPDNQPCDTCKYKIEYLEEIKEV